MQNLSPEQRALPLDVLRLSVRWSNALLRAGVTTIDELLRLTESELLELRSLGSKGVYEIQQALAAFTLNTSHYTAQLPSSENTSAISPSVLHPTLGEYFNIDPVVSELPLSVLTLSARSFNALRRGGIVTLGDLAGHSEESLFSLRNVGKAVLDELADSFNTLDKHLLLQLAIDLPSIEHLPTAVMFQDLRDVALLRQVGIETVGDVLKTSDDTLSSNIAIDRRRLGMLLGATRQIDVAVLMQLVDRARQYLAVDSIDKAVVVNENPHLGDLSSLNLSVLEHIEQLLGNLSERQRIIIELRFGVVSGSQLSMEEIGNHLGITRARVDQLLRQIISSLRTQTELLEALLDPLENALEHAGGLLTRVAAREALCATHDCSGIDSGGLLELLIELTSNIQQIKRFEVVALTTNEYALLLPRINDVGRMLKDVLGTAQAPLTWAEMLAQFKKLPNTIDIPDTWAEACAKVLPEFTHDVEGNYGLQRWRHGRLDDLIMVLREARKPLHFREIARLVNERLPSEQQASEQTIHGHIGRLPDTFVRVGNGIFGLAEWDLVQERSVADTLVRLLEEAGHPMHHNELSRLVLLKWQIREATTRATLDADTRFERLGRGIYWLRGQPWTGELPQSEVSPTNRHERRPHTPQAPTAPGFRKHLTYTLPQAAPVAAMDLPDHYDEWNTGLIEYFTAGVPRGGLLYLSVDDEVIEEVARSGTWSQTPNFLAAIRQRLVRQHRVDLRSIQGHDTHGRPKGVAFLSALVLAATRMADDEAFSQANYFVRLREVLGLPSDDGRPAGMRAGAEAEEPLWQTWNQWLQEQGFLPTSYQGEGNERYIRYARSQALLRGVDKERLRRFFAINPAMAHWSGSTLLAHLRREAPSLSQHLRDLLAATGQRAQAVEDAITEFSDLWHPDDKVTTGHGGTERLTLPPAGLYRTADVVSGEITYFLYPRQPRRRRSGMIQVELNSGIQLLEDERPGWFTPVEPVGEQELDHGGHYTIIEPKDLGKLTLPQRRFWILIPDPDDSDEGAQATWGSPPLGTPFTVLCHRDVIPQLEHLRTERLLQWDGAPASLTWSDHWFEVRHCMVVSQAWGTDSSELQNALRPRESLAIGVGGGLRTPVRGGWLDGYGPELTVFGFHALVEVSVRRVSDEQVVWQGMQEANLSFAIPWPGSGDYRVEAEAGGQSAIRLVRIVPWEELRIAIVAQPESLVVGSHKIRGAFVEGSGNGTLV